MRRSASYLALGLLAVSACRERKAPRNDAPAKELESAGDVALVGNDEPVRIVYPAAPGSFVELSEELAPSVVHLRSTHKVSGGPGELVPSAGDSYALGTAFVLDREGHLVTNEHIIATAPELRVVLADGSELTARVVGRDSKLDLALLKIDAPVAMLKPVRLGESGALKVGEWVLALGNPQGTEVTASAGIISSLGASERDNIAGTRTNYQSFLQTDATINVGNSGGPLIDTSGAVIGICSAIESSGDKVNLVVPIDRAKQIFPMLKKDGRVTRAWLGVFVHPVTAELAKERGLEQASGALVSEVVPSSPAAKAGVKAGDVIIEFDGKKVDHRNLPWLASTSGLGRKIPVLVWRAGQARELMLVGEKMPE